MRSEPSRDYLYLYVNAQRTVEDPWGTWGIYGEAPWALPTDVPSKAVVLRVNGVLELHVDTGAPTGLAP